MIFQTVDQLRREGLDIACDAEGPVIYMAAGAARNLAKLGGRQVAVILPIEFAGCGKGDMIEIEIEPHADSVGRNKEIDIARLIKLNLRVARARAQRAQEPPPPRRADGGSARRPRKRR